jgi:hypothetical protein
MLLRYAPSGDRVLGLDVDEEFEGWRAHLSVLQALRGEGRVDQVGHRSTGGREESRRLS